ncbi:hypothetical protein KJ742_04350, partial [Patescibacteria group bacterium]|nr:hypothetical protein [Patescibacteria group bacterium]
KTINLLQNKNIDFLGLNVSRFTIKPRQTKAEINKWLNEDVLNFKKNKYKSKKIKNRKTGKIKKVSVIEQVNEKIQGWSNFYRSYHVDDLYNQINRSLTQISEKNINLKLLQLLEPIKHKGIPDEQEWQQYFKIN